MGVGACPPKVSYLCPRDITSMIIMCSVKWLDVSIINTCT